MQIFNSFDSRLDEKEFLEGVEKFGEGNVLLVRRHWIFLQEPFWWMIFAILLFGVLLRFTYMQYYDTHLTLFRIIFSAYCIVTLWWIISTIFIIMKEIKRSQVYISHITDIHVGQGAFEWFLKQSIFVLIAQTVIALVNIAFVILLQYLNATSRFAVIGQAAANALLIWVVYVITKKVIDYEMDFTIFTPEKFTLYSQTGFFQSGSTSINTLKIKTIHEQKQGFFSSLWGFGGISIQTEGDADQGPIVLNYTAKPKSLIKKLDSIIELIPPQPDHD